MTPLPRRHRLLAVTTLAAGVCLLAASRPGMGRDTKKPGLSLKASPPVAFAPARIVFTAQVKGGDDDYAEFYCPGIRWDWGDGTVSESAADCEPYEAGHSTIKRRYAAEHVFAYGGAYRVRFSMKRREKVLAVAAAVVQVRPGLRGVP